MKVAFDVHPLLNKQMTGIGYNAAFSIKTLIKNHAENEYIFEFFALRKLQEKLDIVQPYLKSNCSLNYSRLFTHELYKMVQWLIPIPYQWFFGKKADVYHFFSFYLPPFVPGKKVLTVHDLTFKINAVRHRFNPLFTEFGIKMKQLLF